MKVGQGAAVVMGAAAEMGAADRPRTHLRGDTILAREMELPLYCFQAPEARLDCGTPLDQLLLFIFPTCPYPRVQLGT